MLVFCGASHKVNERTKRLTDNTAEARLLRSVFRNGSLTGHKRSVSVRLHYLGFLKYFEKVFGEKFRRFKKDKEEGIVLSFPCIP